MSAAPEPAALRAIALAINFILAIVLATYFFGLNFLLGLAVVGAFVMLGVLIYLASPSRRFN